MERALVEQVVDALAGRHLAACVLALDGALGAGVERLLLALARAPRAARSSDAQTCQPFRVPACLSGSLQRQWRARRTANELRFRLDWPEDGADQPEDALSDFSFEWDEEPEVVAFPEPAEPTFLEPLETVDAGRDTAFLDSTGALDTVRRALDENNDALRQLSEAVYELATNVRALVDEVDKMPPPVSITSDSPAGDVAATAMVTISGEITSAIARLAGELNETRQEMQGVMDDVVAAAGGAGVEGPNQPRIIVELDRVHSELQVLKRRLPVRAARELDATEIAEQVAEIVLAVLEPGGAPEPPKRRRQLKAEPVEAPPRARPSASVRSALTDELEPPSLLAAYAAGYFPMPVDGEIGWFSPDPRAIIPLDGLRVVAIAAAVDAAHARRRSNADFGAVIPPAPIRRGRTGGSTSRSSTRTSGCTRSGYAHASKRGTTMTRWPEGCTAWRWAGCSPASRCSAPVATRSKVALVAPVERLRAGGGILLDMQWLTPHLESLGAIEVPRDEYLSLLAGAVARPQLGGAFQPLNSRRAPRPAGRSRRSAPSSGARRRRRSSVRSTRRVARSRKSSALSCCSTSAAARLPSRGAPRPQSAAAAGMDSMWP